jgi:hypothetical protein
VGRAPSIDGAAVPTTVSHPAVTGLGRAGAKGGPGTGGPAFIGPPQNGNAGVNGSEGLPGVAQAVLGL